MLLSWISALYSSLRRQHRQVSTAPRRPAKARTRRPVPLCLEPLEDRLTPSLSAVSATNAYPYRAVVELAVTFPDGVHEYGSGAMVDSFHVLTAGHMLYSAKDGGFATPGNIIVTPALNGTASFGQAPYGTATNVSELIYNRWATASADHPGQTAPGDYDIGLITLNRAIGNLTGWFGMYYQTTNDPGQLNSYYSSLSLNTAGYPGNGLRLQNGQIASGSTMYQEFGRVSGVNDPPWFDFWIDGSTDGLDITFSDSSIEAHPGQSGSPLWYYDGSSTNSSGIMGVVVSAGAATRITQQMYNDFHNQMNYDALYHAPLPDWVATGNPPSGTYTSADVSFTPTSLWSSSNNPAPAVMTPAAPAGTVPPPATPTAPPAGTSPPQGSPVIPVSTIGEFDPSTATWYLKNSNAPGAPDIAPFRYGAPGWIPVVGDWDGNGTVTIGVVDPATETWYLRNSNGPGAPDIAPFRYGAPGWTPLVGDWSGAGSTGIGVFDPSTATFALRNEPSPGAPDAGQFRYGAPGWIPVVGDWDGNGTTTVGVVDPTTETWYLRNSNTAGAPDIAPFRFGAAGWIPVVGDWDGDGKTTIGAVDPATETWYLRNSASAGGPDIAPFAFGAPEWDPLAGQWFAPTPKGKQD
jgi:V8-like Glu-specific endopeptidase